MGSRKHNEPSPLDELFDFLTGVSTWVGPVLGVVLFVGCRWVLPFGMGLLGGDEGMMRSTMDTLSLFAVRFSPLVLGVVLVLWVGAEAKKLFDRRLLDRQTGRASIDELSWPAFESLLCEAFRRQGFAVEHTGGPRPDGGIDQRLTKAGAVTLVQCKHWKHRSVGVGVVRELLGVVTSERAQSGIVVTSGRFTAEAEAFADRNPIRLIGGDELARMIAQVQKTANEPKATAPKTAGAKAARPRAVPTPPASAIPSAGSADASAPEPVCPKCGAPMKRRIAKRGPMAGEAFFGCSTYPACRATWPAGGA